MKSEKKHRLRRKGIYLLPNLFTTLALFFGFFAIISALKGRFDTMAETVFIAMIFDSLDGRIARMTNTTSAFGAEYDSLSDMVTFGIAPALAAYSWGLYPLGKFGWLIAFLYAVATALRLARFNISTGTASKRFFEGLPCPAAAAVIVSMIWTGSTNLDIIGAHISIIVAIVTLLMAILMVSSVPFYSFKEINLKGPVPFIMIIIFIALCVVVAMNPPPVLFIGFFLFTLSGPITYLFIRKQRRRLVKGTKRVNSK